MHIPDGFLSPQTCAVCYAAAAPFWVTAWRSLKKQFHATTAAHIGMAAAFVFLLQMINIPIPGGTSGHAIGAAMVAIALGPSAAIIAVSLALFLQATVFGDGGLWSYGANVLTMAVIQAWVAWGVWQLTGSRATNKKWIGVGAFAAGYLAALAGAVITGILLGIQPVLFKSASGAPLYFPLGLGVTLPAMTLSHLLVGVIEGTITLGAITTLAAMPDFQFARPVTSSLTRRLLVCGLALMVFLVPAGVILPSVLNAGDPWGEWSPAETAEIGGQKNIPEGMAKYADGYSAPIPDYQFGNAETLSGESVQYMGAALLAMALVAIICLPLHRLQQRRLQKLRNGG